MCQKFGRGQATVVRPIGAVDADTCILTANVMQLFFDLQVMRTARTFLIVSPLGTFSDAL